MGNQWFYIRQVPPREKENTFHLCHSRLCLKQSEEAEFGISRLEKNENECAKIRKRHKGFVS